MSSKVYYLVVCAVSFLGGVACVFAQPQNANRYLELDGVNDTVTVEDADFISDQLTLETWVRLTSVHPDFAAGLVTYGSPTESSFDFTIGPIDNPVPIFFINWNQGQKTLVGNTPIPFNEWHHLAAVYDGSTAKIYIDGVLDSDEVFDAAILPSGADTLLAIGDDYPGNSEFLGGSFDEVRIWNIARSQAEIVSTMDITLIGDEPGLFGYYDFDEGGSQIVVDKSSHHAHGQMGFSLSQGDDDPARMTYSPSRMRELAISSSSPGDTRLVVGDIPEQLTILNAGPPALSWEPIGNRHADMHVRDSFVCTGNDLDRPFVDAQTYLDQADEVTLNNCASSFYRFGFDLPIIVPNASVYGVANTDDLGVVFLNGTAISPKLSMDDVNTLGTDHLVGSKPVLGWPSADQLFELDAADIILGGHNEITFGVCSDASQFEPGGLEFQIVIEYECLADWDANGDVNTIDFTAYLNDWNERLPSADLNGDGNVNTLDVLVWLNLWTQGCPPGSN